MAKNKAGAPIESKAVAGPTTAVIIGYICWAILTFVPHAATAIPADLQGQLPVVIGAVFGAIAAYRAPHTHRPDLTPELVSLSQVLDAIQSHYGLQPGAAQARTGSVRVVTPTIQGGGGVGTPGPTTSAGSPGEGAWPQ
jgi:hypothetical protein